MTSGQRHQIDKNDLHSNYAEEDNRVRSFVSSPKTKQVRLTYNAHIDTEARSQLSTPSPPISTNCCSLWFSSSTSPDVLFHLDLLPTRNRNNGPDYRFQRRIKHNDLCLAQPAF